MNIETTDPKEQSLIDRANRYGREVIGQPYKIKTGKKTFATGVITECGFGRFHRTPRSNVAIFRIVMKCGSAEVEREFFCRTIPRV